MRNSSLSLYLEINTTHFIFFVGKSEEEKNFEVIYKLELPISGITNSRISDLENFFNILKENIYLMKKVYHRLKTPIGKYMMKCLMKYYLIIYLIKRKVS